MFFVIEHFNGECLALKVYRGETEAHYLHFFKRLLHAHPVTETPLTLCHDNHPALKSKRVRAMLAGHRVLPRAILPLVPKGNAIAERFGRTLKENLLLLRSFNGFEDLPRALEQFRRLYNEQWLVAEQEYRTSLAIREQYLEQKT